MLALAAKRDVEATLMEIKLCSKTRNLRRGLQVHEAAIRSRNDSNIYVATALVDMYAKCGRMAKAHRVFDNIKHPDVIAWTALILGHAENGEGDSALDSFVRMRSQGCSPNSRTFVAAIKACTSLASVAECRAQGKLFHKLAATELGGDGDIYVQNALIDMYAKCGRMNNSRAVFESMKLPDVVSWNTLILGYSENGQGCEALDLFARMRSQRCCAPNVITFVAALKSCSSLISEDREANKAKHEQRGRQLHILAAFEGCATNIYVQSVLIDMYMKSGFPNEAQKVFDIIANPDVVAWTTLILGYAENGQRNTALELFSLMRSSGCTPDPKTMVAALKACSPTNSLTGKQLHFLACQKGFDTERYVQNTLIDMYAKAGRMVDARDVFKGVVNPDVVSWTALILGYAENGDGESALQLFTLMKSQGCTPDAMAMAAALKACGLLGALEFGRAVLSDISSNEGTERLFLVNCLVDFFAKCGSMTEAQEAFDGNAGTRDLATWTSLLAGYSRLGDTKAVFRVLGRMLDAGLRPDGVTLTCVLTACSHAGLVDEGKACFDAMLPGYGVTPGLEHYTCMVDLLGRSNKLDDAMVLLRSMPCKPDAVIWMTALAACRKWSNVGVGKLAFTSLVSTSSQGSDAAAYTLMAHIYGAKGMRFEEEMVQQGRCKAWKKPGQSWWTDECGEVHTFVAGEACEN